eukprot:2400982-Amphidinium_carterae.4
MEHPPYSEAQRGFLASAQVFRQGLHTAEVELRVLVEFSAPVVSFFAGCFARLSLIRATRCQSHDWNAA